MSGYVDKYRPKSLKEVYGQATAVTQIKGMLQNKVDLNGTIGIFGPSGVGKTSLAMIIACMVNSIEYTNSNPDIMDCNLGSDRGIEKIREVIALSQYKPRLKYRVIIADEIQCLTGASLSAILKPLEKVPKQTLYILCTDSPNRLPITIMRRCKKIWLKQPEPEAIIPLLEKITNTEKIKLPESKKLLLKIAQSSNGQPSDALQTLEAVADYLRAKSKAGIKDLLPLVQASGKIANQEAAAVSLLIALYKGNLAVVAKAAHLLGGDGMGAIFQLLNLNSYIINSNTNVKGYWSPIVKSLEEGLKNLPKLEDALRIQYYLAQIRDIMLTPGIIIDNHFLVAQMGRVAMLQSNRK